MRVLYVTDFGIVPSAGTADKTLRTDFVDDYLCHPFGVELSPPLIEYDPLHDARMVFESIYDADGFLFEVLPCEGFVSFWKVRTGQVLPYQNSFTVAMHVPA